MEVGRVSLIFPTCPEAAASTPQGHQASLLLWTPRSTFPRSPGSFHVSSFPTVPSQWGTECLPSPPGPWGRDLRGPRTPPVATADPIPGLRRPHRDTALGPGTHRGWHLGQSQRPCLQGVDRQLDSGDPVEVNVLRGSGCRARMPAAASPQRSGSQVRAWSEGNRGGAAWQTRISPSALGVHGRAPPPSLSPTQGDDCP